MIQLCGNQFSGDFKLLAMPESLRQVHVWNNHFSGKIVLLKSCDNLHFIANDNHITSVVDENGRTHPWEEQILKEQRD